MAPQLHWTLPSQVDYGQVLSVGQLRMGLLQSKIMKILSAAILTQRPFVKNRGSILSQLSVRQMGKAGDQQVTKFGANLQSTYML